MTPVTVLLKNLLYHALTAEVVVLDKIGNLHPVSLPDLCRTPVFRLSTVPLKELSFMETVVPNFAMNHVLVGMVEGCMKFVR